MEIRNLRMGEPEAMVAEMLPQLAGAGSVDAAATLFCGALYDRARVAGERSLVLSRIYLSLPFASLDDGGQQFVRQTFSLSPQPADVFLSLVGTRGDAEPWNDRRTSLGHRAIPLNRQTVATVPMLARCFQQIGFDLDIVLKGESGIHLEGVSQSFGLFHVPDALGSPYVPAQDGFVMAHGVRSAIGCGTMLPNGAVSIWIGFSRHPVPDAPLALIPMMPAFWQAAQPLYRRRAFFAA